MVIPAKSCRVAAARSPKLTGMPNPATSPSIICVETMAATM